MRKTSFYANSKPLTRWWWFSGETAEEDVKFQLDWLEEMGFGGVEIAWVYPLPSSKPGPKWLSKEFSSIVSFTKRYANSIGLSCDFTFGTLWPFGGSIVAPEDASMTYKGPSSQRLRKSWEARECPEGLILNHLDKTAVRRYCEKIASALPLDGEQSALFCDSWEVATEGLWTTGFGVTFKERFGYDLPPFMDAINEHPDVRYDYRKHLSDYVLGFYEAFTQFARQNNSFSRVQVHGAPCDLVAGYAVCDVPESEAVLFDPHFSQFAASAAALNGADTVTAETFTCLYGWKGWPGPGQHQGEEQIADLKLLADAMFANGVNLPIWHGTPFNGKDTKNRFYASVHVGPDSSFVGQLKEFNGYMEKVCRFMGIGKTYSSCAVLLPLEDNWMKDLLDEGEARPSAKYHFELHYQFFPHETKPYRPLWITTRFLKRARFESGKLHCGQAQFDWLYVDSEWLDFEALVEIERLAKAGLPICIKKAPKQPGCMKNANYAQTLEVILDDQIVGSDIGNIWRSSPLVECERGTLPEFWCKVDENCSYIFFANPKTKDIHYPMAYGQSCSKDAVEIPITINLYGKKVSLDLTFRPYQSLLFRIENDGRATSVDIEFVPNTTKFGE